LSDAGAAKPVLSDINLDVHPGEIVIPTALGLQQDHAAHHARRTAGAQSSRLRVLGNELLKSDRTALARLRREVGYIFQAHYLQIYLTYLKNMRVSLDVHPN
jgi:putative ABC transport system ATP-binding protein